MTPETAAVTRVLLRLEERPGPLDTPCWIWPGAKNSGSQPYGRIRVGDRVALVHRLVYGFLVGAPPAGWHLHHRCEQPSCANHAHLAPLPPRDHALLGTSVTAINAQKDRCARGHLFSLSNTTFLGRGGRRCLTCHRTNERSRRARARLAA